MLLGNQEQATFTPHEFGAYYRRVCHRLEEFVAAPPPTEPFPCEQCDICAFKPLCDAHWDEVDHLCRVAGISRRQIEKLERDRSRERSPCSARPRPDARPAGMAEATFERLRDQAALQLERRVTGIDRWEILEPQPSSGFALLPDPSPGDLFFDFEGNPFWDEDGSLE